MQPGTTFKMHTPQQRRKAVERVKQMRTLYPSIYKTDNSAANLVAQELGVTSSSVMNWLHNPEMLVTKRRYNGRSVASSQNGNTDSVNIIELTQAITNLINDLTLENERLTSENASLQSSMAQLAALVRK
jgi:hypothetical protein